MKALVIGKPVYEYILPLVEFPENGDKFFIEESLKTMNNFSSVVSILLATYGIDTSFTGVVGEDATAAKIKEIFTNNNVDINCMETSYKEHSCISHRIYNQKTNTFTTIEENSIKQGLLKYKYEFTPDVVIMDNSDYNANMASINNFKDANLIYVAEKHTKESAVYCNKCKYVICNLKFASELTGVLNNLNKPKTMVSLYQKYLDLYNSNLIIKLDNNDMLYCINDEVRLIKNVNNNIKNKDYLFYSLLIYFLINTNDIENSIKYTNKALLNSNSELDMLKNIPDYKEIENYITEINNIKNVTQTEVNIDKNSVVNTTQTENIQSQTVVSNSTSTEPVQNQSTKQNSTPIEPMQNQNTAQISNTDTGVVNNNTLTNPTQKNETVIQNNKVPEQPATNATQPEKITPVEVTKIDSLEIPDVKKGDNNSV